MLAELKTIIFCGIPFKADSSFIASLGLKRLTYTDYFWAFESISEFWPLLCFTEADPSASNSLGSNVKSRLGFPSLVST